MDADDLIINNITFKDISCIMSFGQVRVKGWSIGGPNYRSP